MPPTGRLLSVNEEAVNVAGDMGPQGTDFVSNYPPLLLPPLRSPINFSPLPRQASEAWYRELGQKEDWKEKGNKEVNPGY